MSKKPYFFNGKLFPSMLKAWLSIAKQDNAISYNYFTRTRPIKKDLAIATKIIHSFTRKHKVFMKKYENYMDFFIKIIESGGPKTPEEIELFSLCFDKIKDIKGPEVPQPENHPIIPSENNVKSAEKIIDILSMVNLNLAEQNLLNAAKQEIINYNLRSCRNN